MKTRILGTAGEVSALGLGTMGMSALYGPADRDAAPSDFRAHSPRFQGDNLDRNLALVEALRGVATEAGVSVAQAAISWVSSCGDDIVPLVGARNRARLAEALGAVDFDLGGSQLAAIEAAVPVDEVAGDRYNSDQMAMLDSER